MSARVKCALFSCRKLMALPAIKHKGTAFVKALLKSSLFWPE